MRHIRGISDELAARLRSGAGARGWTQAQYIEALVELHDTCRARADIGGGFSAEGLRALLTALGLETIRA